MVAAVLMVDDVSYLDVDRKESRRKEEVVDR
jgi:hypothetical protein